MGARGRARKSAKASGGGRGAASVTAAVVASAVASATLLFFSLLLIPILASAATNNSTPSSPSSLLPPPFLAAATRPNGDRLENWSLTSTIVPPPPSSSDSGRGGNGGVAFVEPASVEEVQRVVRGDVSRFPSPLLTVGSGHSSGEVVSLYDPRTGKYSGTILKSTKLCGMSLEEGGGEGGKKKHLVRVGAGVELADLHDWLAERGLEISMSPEIGDATVGSAAAASTKDSSVAGGADDGDFGEGKTSSSSSSSSRPRAPPYPSSDLYKGMGDGYLGALVRGLRYVNASGHLVDLDSRRGGNGGNGNNDDEMQQIRKMAGSFGLMGPIVDVLLEARPLALVETRVKIVPLGELESDLEFAKKIIKIRDECDNLMVLISLGGVAKTGSRVEVSPGFRPVAYVEMRTRRRGADRRSSSPPLLNRLLVSWWLPELIRRTKFGAFAEGSPPSWLLTVSRVPLVGRVLDGGAAAVTPRRFFVNRYGPAVAGRPRLSFTYYELVDFARFPEAVAALMSLARDFERRTGWAPGALAVYFVRRGGEKETSNYSGPKGISCTLDPVTGAPGDPRFRQFLAESDALIQSLGGRLSPSQSLPSALESENDETSAAVDFGGLDQSLVGGESGKRFATPYLRRVFAADARAQELKREGRG